MTLPTPRAVIFDWDNTLVDTWPIIRAALNATFVQWGMPKWSMEQVQARVRRSMRDSFPGLFGKDWKQAGDFYREQYRLRHLDALEALPQASEVLARVKSMQLFSVVVSNKLGPSLREEVKHLGWDKFFDGIVGSDDAGRDKPHADPVLLAFDKSHLKPGKDVWFIGDSEVDLECAHATGCTAILYGESAKAHPGFSATHFNGFAYDAHVHNHGEILKLLSSYP